MAGLIVWAKWARLSQVMLPALALRHAARTFALVVEAAAAANRDVKVSSASRAWLDAAVKSGAADLDFSAAVATITGEEPQP